MKYQNLEISKIYEEHISGAKKNVERPILQQAIEYCKANSVGILLVSELSRLGRNAFEVLANVKDLIDSGINFSVIFLVRISRLLWCVRSIRS